MHRYRVDAIVASLPDSKQNKQSKSCDGRPLPLEFNFYRDLLHFGSRPIVHYVLRELILDTVQHSCLFDGGPPITAHPHTMTMPTFSVSKRWKIRMKCSNVRHRPAAGASVPCTRMHKSYSSAASSPSKPILARALGSSPMVRTSASVTESNDSRSSLMIIEEEMPKASPTAVASARSCCGTFPTSSKAATCTPREPLEASC